MSGFRDMPDMPQGLLRGCNACLTGSYANEGAKPHSGPKLMAQSKICARSVTKWKE